MAIDLITGHQGQLHISAEQIATLNNASLNGYGDHKVLRMVNGTVSYTGLVISIATGYWRVNGFDMEIYESENVYIDPSTIGTSRIDRVFVEILQDIPSGVQRSELVVVMGEESANTPIAPDVPTDPELNTDLMLQCEEVCVVTVTEGAMTLADSTIAFNVVTPAELATVDTKVDNALGMIQKSSDAYSDSSPYKVGDYVIHDNKVYICTTACVAGSWATNSGYFTETSLTTAVTGLNSALMQLKNYVYESNITESLTSALSRANSFILGLSVEDRTRLACVAREESGNVSTYYTSMINGNAYYFTRVWNNATYGLYKDSNNNYGGIGYYINSSNPGFTHNPTITYFKLFIA